MFQRSPLQTKLFEHQVLGSFDLKSQKLGLQTITTGTKIIPTKSSHWTPVIVVPEPLAFLEFFSSCSVMVYVTPLLSLRGMAGPLLEAAVGQFPYFIRDLRVFYWVE